MADPHPAQPAPNSPPQPAQGADANTAAYRPTVTAPPARRPAITLDELAARLLQSGLITATDLQVVKQRLQPLTVNSLVTDLVASEKFTRFQIDTILAGNAPTLFVGEYLVLDKIGAGGMGQVFKALHRKMNRVVALKVLPPQVVPSKDAVQRFLREVQAVAKLSHPNIVVAYDAGEQGGGPYLAMEFIQGTDLHRHVKQKGPLPIAEALNLILQTARGLHYAHSSGVIHRDIKPMNLLLNTQGAIKILDLGLAKVKGDATFTASGVAIGTPDYLSPEQGLNAAAVDHRTDIYSLGCTLYFLLTGKPVYQGDSLVMIIMAHQQSPVPSLRTARAEVPKKLDAVFQKMLAKKPEDRYQSMSDVMTDLAAVQKDMEARPHRRKRRRVAAFLFLSALVITGAILAAVYHPDRIILLPPPPTTEITESDGDPDQEPPPWPPGGGPTILSPEVEAVVKKLRELNPAFDGKVTQKIEQGVATGFGFVTDNVTDISPVRRLTGLKTLVCAGSERGTGKLADLSPLRGMPLTELRCGKTHVADLSPLEGMPLTSLRCYGTQVADLSPLRGMPLSHLDCGGTQVSDLSPLKGMPLTELHCRNTQVSDLSALKGMPLTVLGCGHTKVSDLSPLKGMPLTELHCVDTEVSDLSPLQGMPLQILRCNRLRIKRNAMILRSIKTLETINGKPAKEVLK